MPTDPIICGENGSLVSLTGPPLSISEIQAAFSRMAAMVDTDGKPVVIDKVRLILPPRRLRWPLVFEIYDDGTIYADPHRLPWIIFMGRPSPFEREH